jgi:hypothetical protein
MHQDSPFPPAHRRLRERFTQTEVMEIRDLGDAGKPYTDIAPMYNTTPGTIGKIVRRDTYSHFPEKNPDVTQLSLEQFFPKVEEVVRQPPKTKRKKITPAQKKNIRALRKRGYATQEIADALNISLSSVNRYGKVKDAPAPTRYMPIPKKSWFRRTTEWMFGWE